MRSELLIPLLFFFVLLGLWSIRKPRSQAGRKWQLLRVLVPTWRFFDFPGDQSEMLIRSGRTADDLCEWHPCHKPVRRNPLNLFIDGPTNYRLACNTLIEQLLSDLSDWDERNIDRFPESVSFTLAKHLACFEAKAAHAAKFYFQFKIVTHTAPDKLQDVLISEVFHEG